MEANNGPVLTFLAGANLDAGTVVKLSVASDPLANTAATVVNTGAGEGALAKGVVDAYAASGTLVSVRMLNCGGSLKAKTGGAVTGLANVFCAASGLVDDAAGGTPIGQFKSSGSSGQLVEFIPAEGIENSGVASVAAAGSAQGDAALLSIGVNTVSAADGTKGVILPVGTAGQVVEVYNAVATNGLKIYPATSGTINGGSANAAITTEGKTHAYLRNIDGTNWAAIFTTNT